MKTFTNLILAVLLALTCFPACTLGDEGQDRLALQKTSKAIRAAFARGDDSRNHPAGNGLNLDSE
jgi:hypothetical protein